MAKSKQQQQKKKDRERRVAQKKLAETHKRTQEQSAQESLSGGTKVSKLVAAVPPIKPDQGAAKPKHSFIRRRSVG